MGLRWSLENIQAWHSQYNRMLRWQRRIRASKTIFDEDPLDLYLAFFVSCYHLQEWLVKSGEVLRQELATRTKQSIPMRLCRDICNRSKHLRINNASIDPTFSVAREYRRDTISALVVLADGNKLDLDEVVVGCMGFWEQILLDLKPAEPKHPFE